MEVRDGLRLLLGLARDDREPDRVSRPNTCGAKKRTSGHRAVDAGVVDVEVVGDSRRAARPGGSETRRSDLEPEDQIELP
jgi:hypothetical protein